MKSFTTSLIVSFDYNEPKDNAVLVVGRQVLGKVDIVNAFEGQEAKDLWNKLVTVRKRGDGKNG